jgi:hypothetical protein
MSLLNILTVSLLLSTGAQAAPNREVIAFTAAVSVHNLKCVTRAGVPEDSEYRTYTLLEGQGSAGLGILHEPKDALALVHRAASVTGCDLPSLDKVVEKSRHGFGFIHEVKLEVVKTTGSSVRAQNGKCLARYDEELTLDFGDNVVLKSHEIKMLEMNDCAI